MASCASVSTPSAVVVKPRLRAMAIVAVTIARSLSSVAMPRTKLWSTFSLPIGKRFR